MFRLIKLALYVLVGYALYEMYQGMQHGGSMAGGREGGRDEGRRGEQFGERMNITGGGRGQTERTEEPSGTSTPHAVGRGVIS